MEKIIKLILHPTDLVLSLAAHGLLPILSDKQYLKIKYKKRTGRRLNIDYPQTFNEKLQWLKLYDHNPEYTTMVDKYSAKKWVADRIGEEYIIPTLGVWNSFDEIDFDKLPDQFVLKCTHDSGGIVICKDKSLFNIEAAAEKLNHALKMNFYLISREWPYKNVPPKIIAEQYMANNSVTLPKSLKIESCIEDKTNEFNDLKDSLTDYKFMCFNGQVRCVFTVTERFSGDGLKVTFFDRDWNPLPFERHYPKSKKPIPKPYNFEKMIELAEKLSENIPFVRVDFYESGGQIYFGEMTFYPGSGFEEFTPEEWDKTLGDWINLPISAGGGGTW